MNKPGMDFNPNGEPWRTGSLRDQASNNPFPDLMQQQQQQRFNPQQQQQLTMVSYHLSIFLSVANIVYLLIAFPS